MSDTTKWRVGEFMSSSNPRNTVLMLAVGSDIEAHEKHHSFIRWVDATPSAPAVDAGARDERKPTDLQTLAKLIADHYASKPDDHVISIGDWRVDPILGAPMREFVAYVQVPLGDFRAALSAHASEAAAGEPVAEVIKWQTFTGHTAWDFKVFDKTLEHGAKLYAAPPAASGQKLTDEQRDALKFAIRFLEDDLEMSTAGHLRALLRAAYRPSNNSLLCAALSGLSNHVKACPAYEKLSGDMEHVDRAISILRASDSATASDKEGA